MSLDPANRPQHEWWNGPQGEMWVEHAERFEEIVAGHRPRLLEAAAVGAADTVLDVGCGAGLTTCLLARDAARVVGVDVSEPLLDLARLRAADAGLETVTFRADDAQVADLGEAAFDVVVSQNGSMFFAEPVAAFANLARATRPGGRLVLLVWEPLDRNEFFAAPLRAVSLGRDLPPPPDDAPSPLALSDPDRVRDVLSAAGFVDIALEGLPGQALVGRDVDEATTFLARHQRRHLEDLSEDDHARALAALRDDAAAHLRDGGVVYDSAEWLVTARRG